MDDNLKLLSHFSFEYFDIEQTAWFALFSYCEAKILCICVLGIGVLKLMIYILENSSRQMQHKIVL